MNHTECYSRNLKNKELGNGVPHQAMGGNYALKSQREQLQIEAFFIRMRERELKVSLILILLQFFHPAIRLHLNPAKSYEFRSVWPSKQKCLDKYSVSVHLVSDTISLF